MNPFRIAMVSEHASPLALLGGVDAGGQNVHVAELARHLAPLGAEVTVYTRRDDPRQPERVCFTPGVDVVHLDAGPAAPLAKDELLGHMSEFADGLAQRLQRDPPDAIHAHFWMSAMASLASRPASAPVAVTFHALGSVKRRCQGPADTSPPERIAVEHRVAQEVDLVLATSRDELRELSQLGSIAPAVVIPCGVDLARFRPDGPALPRGRARRVVVVSRLVARKGIAEVVTALAQLPSDVELVIAGGPPAALLDHDPEAARLRALAAELGVADRVELLGALDRDAVPALLRSADVVACCPWYEPFGMVAVEAMACGAPVVATRVGGLAETVLDGGVGLLTPPRRPDEIAAALRRLLDDDALRAAMRAKAAARAAHYGWHAVAARTYGQLAAAAAARSRRVGQLERTSR